MSMQIEALGCRVELSLGGSRAEELRAALARAWSRCLAADDGAQADASIVVTLLASGEPVPDGFTLRSDLVADRVSGASLAAVLQNTTQAVTYAVIAARAGELLMLHGGACASPSTGAAVVFVAPGGMGKTTLASILGRELGYVTDETVGITPTGDIVAYQKPLSLRPREGSGPKIETSPDDLGLLRAPAQPWLKRIVLLRRDPGLTGSPLLTALDMPQAVTALAPETSSLSRLPRPLHLLADLLDRTGPALRCDYRETAELAPILAEMVAS